MIKKLLILMVIAFLLLVLALCVGFWQLNASPNLNDKAIEFTLERGTTANQLAYQLNDLGFIKSPLFFRVYAKVKGIDNLFKAGNYLIPAGFTTSQTAELLAKGKTVLYSVTISEGKTLKQVANLLEGQGVVRATDFIAAASDPAILSFYGITGANAMGFLFPDTYYLGEKPYPARDMVTLMIDTFFEKLATIEPDYKDLSLQELNEKVTMAGLVEKEYRVADEAAVMAGVFYNRLKIDMKLESCASVVYVLTEEQGRPHPNRIFFSDLEVKSPYNVYANKGLPPGPISNPGLVALRAAFQPAEHSYLFFVVKDLSLGSHQFSSNLADHEAGREAYISNFFAK